MDILDIPLRKSEIWGVIIVGVIIGAVLSQLVSWLRGRLLRGRLAQTQNQEKKVLESRITELEESLRLASSATAMAPATATAKSSPQGSLETVVFLSLLQEKGRLIDFIMRDIATFSDEEVGRVARFVHQGVNNVFRDCILVEPLTLALEGDPIVLEKGYDPVAFALLKDGSVADQCTADQCTADQRTADQLTAEGPPYSGKVVHRGWKIKSMNIPKLVANQDEAGVAVLAPVLIKT